MNAEQTKLILKQMPTEKSVMLRAKHGVGKSSVMRQVAEELGIGFYDVRLSQCEVGDIKGLPNLDVSNRVTEFFKPYWWPRDPDSKGILLFDELNRATKDVLQAIFEVCLDRRLDGEKLPDGWRVVTAVNADDEYDVIDMDPALLDRWFVIDFDPSHKEWRKWARANDVHDSVVEFISRNEEMLDPPVESGLESGKIYPSRRSWVAFSDVMQVMDGAIKDPGLLTELGKGWVGREAAIQFQKFIQNEYSRLRPGDILDNFDDMKERVEESLEDIEVAAALTRSVIDEVNRRSVRQMKEDVQVAALREFLMILPKEIASDAWMSLLQGKRSRAIALKYFEPDEELTEYLGSVYSHDTNI